MGDSPNRLSELAGDWVGDEIVAPSPWYPRGGPAVGRTTARMALRGKVLVTDYVEERDGKVILEGHGVYTWEARDVYRMYWFDSSGPGPDTPLEGRWIDETLTFERPAFAGGRVRYVYTVRPKILGTADEAEGYTFRIEQAKDVQGAKPDWRVLMEGKYRRNG